MSDSKTFDENEDKRLEKKIKKKCCGKRRQCKMNLENLKYGVDEDSYYDMIDDIMEN